MIITAGTREKRILPIDIILTIMNMKGMNPMKDKKANIVLKVSPEFRKQLRLYCTMKGISFQSYITQLITADSGIKL